MFKPLRFAAAALVLSAIGSPLAAQATRLPSAMFDVTGVADTSIFAPLNLPVGTVYRSGAGTAGPKYFQQRADYDLHGTLDTAAKALKGEMTLRYTNNSPDTLRFIWIQTEQNAFKAGSLNSFVFPADSRFGARNFEGGDVFDHFNQIVAGKTSASKLRVEGTVTKVDLVAPLAPGQTATFNVAWHFLIPEHGADRMGRDGALFELAQWYPRVCVYDDLRGWNTEPYLGQGEFYLEYGDYKLAVTVPAGYIVAATGVLENPTEVLTAAEISRLATAKSPKSDSTVVHIITADELKNGTARKTKNGMVTWRFAAHSVRDAVWAASPDYMWDATNYKGHMAYGYYRPSAIDTWKEAADMSRMSIQEYSERWFEYPYPQISAVEGPISGMEYPMLAMETKSETNRELYNVVTHEIGHMWYPMIVGSNERMHMWQDEGFNTFINYFSEARRYPDSTYAQRVEHDRNLVVQFMQHDFDEPLEVPPDRINPQLLGENAYVKTAVGLSLLREEILGPTAFDEGFREYTRRWAFKHPSPSDFFHTMEDVGGRRLDWFFREWFIENPHFDQAVDTVAKHMSGNVELDSVQFSNRARGVLPIRARFIFSDGSSQNVDYPAEVWSTNTRYYIRTFQFTGKTLTKVVLDPDNHLPDEDRTNNSWPKGG
jgi:hypothetical protein